MLLPDTDVQSAHQIAEKIRQAVADLVIPLPNQQSIHITASIGVACDMHCHHALEEIQQQADLAMYQAVPGSESGFMFACHGRRKFAGRPLSCTGHKPSITGDTIWVSGIKP